MAKKRVNPKSLENLKPYPKGVSGNKGGRPKKRPMTDEYFQMSDEPIPEKVRKRVAKEWEMEVPPGTTWSRANAMRRNLDALEPGGHMSSKEMREAMEGKAPERLEISGPEHKIVTLHLVHEDRRRK